jgi:hypothetical protein
VLNGTIVCVYFYWYAIRYNFLTRANTVPIKKAGEMGMFAAFSFDGLILGQSSLIFSPIAKQLQAK